MNLEKNYQVAANTLNINPGVRQQSQRTSALQGSTPQVELMNSMHWVNPSFQKIQLMKEMYLSDLIVLFHRAQEGRRLATNAEMAIRFERTRIFIERIIRFLNMSRSDLLQWRKEKLYLTMECIIKYVARARATGSPPESLFKVGGSSMMQPNQYGPMRSSAQQWAPQGSVVSSSSHKGSQMVFDQNALGISSRNAFNSLDYSASLVAQSSNPMQPVQQSPSQKNRQQILSQKMNDNARLRRLVGHNDKWSPLPSSSSSLHTISPQNPQGSSSQHEMKDLSSNFAKSARPSVPVSASAVPSPLTPSSASAEPPLQETNQNQLVTKTKGFVKSSLDKGDPLKFLIDVVKSISSRALKAALLDLYGVTNSANGVAGHLLHGKSKVLFQDLADDISNYGNGDFSQLVRGVKSRMKRQLDTVTSNDMPTEAEFCASGRIKRLKKEPNDTLLQEIKEINQKLIEVVVDVVKVVDVSRPGSDEGTLIRFSYIPVGISGNIKMPNTSKKMFPSLALELIVADDYPNSSPTILESIPAGCSDAEEGRYLWMKAKSEFSLLLRKHSQPLSLKDMTEAWDVCSRELFREFAMKVGVDVVCSRHGKWENCVVAS